MTTSSLLIILSGIALGFVLAKKWKERSERTSGRATRRRRYAVQARDQPVIRMCGRERPTARHILVTGLGHIHDEGVVVMSDQSAVTEVRGRVLLITLNRPDQMNAVNTDLAQGLVAAIRELDRKLTAGVLTGAGRILRRNGPQAFLTDGPPVGSTSF